MSTGIPCKIINNETIEKIYGTEEKTPVKGRKIDCNACTDPYNDDELEYDDRELEYEYEPGISLSALHFSRENNAGKWLGHCKGCRCISSAPSEHCGGCVCLQESDLQLAAELGKTLLERNRELENSIKHQQSIIDDQGQEIEYLTKQTTALREVNESRIRVYEQMEISLQEVENTNSKLLEESSSDKSRIKSLSGLVEHLEQKCEELQCLIQFNKKQVEVQELRRKKQGRKGSGIDGTRRSSLIQEERKLELEVIELNTEVEQLTELRKQDDSRILELEEQILSLVVEKKRLILEAGQEEGEGGEGRRSTQDYSVLVNTHNRGNPTTCLCSELLRADCVKQMSKSNSNDQLEDQECHVNVKTPKQLDPTVNFNENDNPVNEKRKEVPIEKIENSSGDNYTSLAEETNEHHTNAANDQDLVVHGVLIAEEKSGMLIDSAVTAVSKWDIKDTNGSKPNFRLGLKDDRGTKTNLTHLTRRGFGTDLFNEEEEECYHFGSSGTILKATSLQDELKMSGQFDPESDTLSSGFSDGSENKFCSRETQTEASPTPDSRTESTQYIRTDQDIRPDSAQDSLMKQTDTLSIRTEFGEFRDYCSLEYNPEYRAIFREMFRVLQEAKKNPQVVLKPKTNRRRPENPPRKFVDKLPRHGEYTSLSEEKVSSKMEVSSSYAQILRKGIKK